MTSTDRRSSWQIIVHDKAWPIRLSFALPWTCSLDLDCDSLRFNSFSGEILDHVFAKNLDTIFLNDNQFEGQILMNIWNYSASVITLTSNKLSGPIPSSFGYAGTNLKEILFLNNNLTGCIPEAIGYLNEPEMLDLSFNSLAGKLPSTISFLSAIVVLNIGRNQLSRELSDVICNLKSLANWTVAYSFFSGFDRDCAQLFFRNAGFVVSRGRTCSSLCQSVRRCPAVG